MDSLSYCMNLIDRLVLWKNSRHSLNIIGIYVSPDWSDRRCVQIEGLIDQSDNDIVRFINSKHPVDQAFYEEVTDWFKIGKPYNDRDTSTVAYQSVFVNGEEEKVIDFLIDLKKIVLQKYPEEKIHFTIPEKKQNGCYIATAVYGSYDCPEVWILRRYRDEKLLTTIWGKLFVKIYYMVSPTVVRIFGRTECLKQFWKTRLNRMVNTLQKSGYDSTPYYDR